MLGDTEMNVVIRERIRACYLYFIYTPVFTVIGFRQGVNERTVTEKCELWKLHLIPRLKCAQVPYEFYSSIVCWHLTHNSHIEIREVVDGWIEKWRSFEFPGL